MIACAHAETKRFGFDRKRNPRVRCLMCGKTWTMREPNPLCEMRVPVEKAKLALRLLVEGMSIRATERTTGVHRDSICTSHVERLNGTQRVFLKRLNRLTLCFSKKLRNLEAAFAMFAAYYNFCWQTRKPGKSGQKRATAAMMAKVAGHVWGFDELFEAVLG